MFAYIGGGGGIAKSLATAARAIKFLRQRVGGGGGGGDSDTLFKFQKLVTKKKIIMG